MEESSPVITPKGADDYEDTASGLTDTNSTQTATSMHMGSLSNSTRYSPGVTRLVHLSEPSNIKSTQTSTVLGIGSPAYNPMAIANLIHPSAPCAPDEKAATSNADLAKTSKTTKSENSDNIVKSETMKESEPFNELKKAALSKKRSFDEFRGISPTTEEKPEMKTYTWPFLHKSSRIRFPELQISSIEKSEDREFHGRNIRFERSGTITSFKKDSQWTTGSEFISNKVNKEPTLSQRKEFDRGEALGVYMDLSQFKAEEIVIRVLSWDKNFLVHINVADAPRYLELIRSEIRGWFRYAFAKSRAAQEGDVYHIKIRLPFLLVSDKSQTIGGTCTGNEPFSLCLSKNLALDIAQFDWSPRVGFPTSLANGNRAASASSRKVIVHFVRHALSEQNAWGSRDWGACVLTDPALTAIGRRQCEVLSTKFPHHSRISQIFSSPSHRALQTTQLSFPAILERGIEVTPWPDIRELGAGIHNTGSEIADLRFRFQTMEVRWKELHDVWPPEMSLNNHKTCYIPLFRRVLNRLYKSGQDAAATDICTEEKNIVEILAVSSGGFLDRLENHFERTNVNARTHWANAEFKSYELKEHDWVDGYGIQQNLVLLETQECRQRGEQAAREMRRRAASFRT